MSIGDKRWSHALRWTKQLSAGVGNFLVIAVGHFMVDENKASLMNLFAVAVLAFPDASLY